MSLVNQFHSNLDSLAESVNTEIVQFSTIASSNVTRWFNF